MLNIFLLTDIQFFPHTLCNIKIIDHTVLPRNIADNISHTQNGHPAALLSNAVPDARFADFILISLISHF
ncbi:hypothetical protein BACPEC_02998 [[Bacteroides] pectinophilus ATCC 43243]|uniref:Uncharacterized protein n=1 Tax=[Bacteroides] pectinophilus ATCC 43243 TaxID=483218 RepID=B7AW98_9FIRM|nr:hypothetical protein BACPEC_02998 [[Bacteroides] pectinophilus ATCC 43243]